MENFLPLTPAQSWLLIAVIVVLSVLVTYIIYGLDQFIGLAIWNCKLTGVKGIGYAFRGLEAYEILREKVIDVTRSETGYSVVTTDSEKNYFYNIIVTRTDGGNFLYDDAIRLSEGNKHLRSALLPDSRVKNFFSIKNKETGEESSFFVVYLKNDNPKDVEEALNKYFTEEFYDSVREAKARLA